MTPIRASVRRQARIDRPPKEVWDLVGDPARVHEWFSGIVSCNVEGDRRVITTAAGIEMPEKILTVDPLQRRFQYRITAPFLKEHLGTIDVLDVGDGSCLVVYGTDAEPATLALVIAGAAGAALEHLNEVLEGDR
ncbi:MAG: SRPBCC family protein [Actinomycetota bacterium]|jgi:uncharacterized protein YndB with AHSA1/START domain|nr:SRPBCC family protein [Actinomycetota bacterium]